MFFSFSHLFFSFFYSCIVFLPCYRFFFTYLCYVYTVIYHSFFFYCTLFLFFVFPCIYRMLHLYRVNLCFLFFFSVYINDSDVFSFFRYGVLFFSCIRYIFFLFNLYRMSHIKISFVIFFRLSVFSLFYVCICICGIPVFRFYLNFFFYTRFFFSSVLSVFNSFFFLFISVLIF